MICTVSPLTQIFRPEGNCCYVFRGIYSFCIEICFFGFIIIAEHYHFTQQHCKLNQIPIYFLAKSVHIKMENNKRFMAKEIVMTLNSYLARWLVYILTLAHHNRDWIDLLGGMVAVKRSRC